MPMDLSETRVAADLLEDHGFQAQAAHLRAYASTFDLLREAVTTGPPMEFVATNTATMMLVDEAPRMIWRQTWNAE